MFDAPPNKYEVEHNRKQQHNKAVSERWTTLVAGLTVAILIFQSGVFGYQAIQLKKTVATMSDTAERQLRAYIGVLSGVIQPGIVDGIPGLLTRVEVKNFGQTPAYDFRSWIRVLIDHPNATPFQFPDSLINHPRSLVSPQVSISIDAGFSPPNDLLSEIKSGAKKLFVWGRIEYRDAFGRPRFFVFRKTNSTYLPLNNYFGISTHPLADDGN
ncbi:MAG: hypothetical protein JO172_02740 [Hyphomicrobiales bacterium]|nr:hypothetical protein [Hyphomicrobiales bacterium]